jgi:hypothetical protein
MTKKFYAVDRETGERWKPAKKDCTDRATQGPYRQYLVMYDKPKIRLVTSFQTLMRLAHELGKARKSGDDKRIREAQRAHDEYRDLCLVSDEMVLDCTSGYLNQK